MVAESERNKHKPKIRNQLGPDVRYMLAMQSSFYKKVRIKLIRLSRLLNGAGKPEEADEISNLLLNTFMRRFNCLLYD